MIAVAEYIELWFDYDDPPEYVRGHVDEAAARKAINDATGGAVDGLDEFELKHRWARWEPAGSHMRACGCDRVMNVYDDKGRGMFAVTEMKRRPKPAPPREAGTIAFASPTTGDA